LDLKREKKIIEMNPKRSKCLLENQNTYSNSDGHLAS